jgi:hypothetical protein
MSNHDERFAQIKKTWFDARANYEEDRAKAPTLAEKKKVDGTHNEAFEAFAAALDSALSQNAPAVETAYQDLVDANKAVKKARDDLAAFPALLGKLTKATAASSDLVAKAT